ncbi:SH3 domain-containing protein [bacterium]|nr:SH3 domain-containing protein [bacterium]
MLPSGTGGGGGVIGATGGFASVAPQTTLVFKVDSDTCTLTNISTQPTQIYQEARPESMITGLLTPGAVAMIVLVSEDGWVRVATPQGAHLGWVFGSGLAFAPPCSNLPTPTPTGRSLLPVPTLPAPTPTAGYGAAIGRDTFDFLVVSSDVVGLPANSRVRISSAYYTGSEWIYTVVARSSPIVAEVREWQIRWMPESSQPTTVPTATITPDVVPAITLTPR